MNSPLPGLWPGHYFTTWDSGVVGGNELAGSLVGAPTTLRGTDPAGYASTVLGTFGVLAECPAGQHRSPFGFCVPDDPNLLLRGGAAPVENFWAKAGVFVIALVLVILGVYLVATGEIGKVTHAG